MAAEILGLMGTAVGSEQAFFVLTALADNPRHGYGIVREVAEISTGRVQLKVGALYGGCWTGWWPVVWSNRTATRSIRVGFGATTG